jgi:cytochrome c biogenesis factor
MTKPLIITPAAVLETLDIINEQVTAVTVSNVDDVITIVRDSFHEDARTEQGYAPTDSDIRDIVNYWIGADLFDRAAMERNAASVAEDMAEEPEVYGIAYQWAHDLYVAMIDRTEVKSYAFKIYTAAEVAAIEAAAGVRK